MIVSGIVFSGGRFFNGHVEFEEGVITRVADGSSKEESVAHGLIMPLLTNCHSHIGDACLRGKIGQNVTLDELVHPSRGLKQRMLCEQSDSVIARDMASAVDDMRRGGIGRFIDFREGGLRGIRQLKEAMKAHGYPTSVILSRPETLDYSEREVDELLDQSDGVGVSAARDWEYDDLVRLSEHSRSRKKIFAIHASEGRREEISKILDLRPDFLVHMSSAERRDLEECRARDVPIVVCPRSNARFGIPLDIARMLDAGLEVCIGSDNAMLNPPSILEELRAAYSLSSNSRPLLAQEVLKLAIDAPRKVLKDRGIMTISAGNPCEFMVVRAGEGDTPEELLRSGYEQSIELVSIGSKVWKSSEWKRSSGS